MAGKPASAASRILVVDDALETRVLARAALECRGFDVVEACDGESALDLVACGSIDLITLDVNLRGMSGLAVLTRIRRDTLIPVVLLTALADEADRVIGLHLGADDYIVKPFDPAELGARVSSVLRRDARTAPTFGSATATDDAVADRSIEVRPLERRVLVAGALVDLTPKEFDLLAFLVSAPRRVFSRAELLDRVWGSALEWQNPATVTEHVRRLRYKIEADPTSPCWLQTVRGVGYRFEPSGGPGPAGFATVVTGRSSGLGGCSRNCISAH